MRIAIDAMGGDHGPGSIIDGALVAARHLQIGLLLVGARAVDRRELRAASRRRGARHRDRSTRPSASRWRSRRRRRCGASRGRRFASRPRRSATAAPTRSSAPVTPARRSWRRTRRSAGCRASIGPRWRRSSRRAAGRPCCSIPARRSNAVRSTSCSSRSWARRMRASRSGCESPRVGLLSVGEEESKGNELTREAHQLLKSAPVRFIGNVEGPRRLRGRRRRHRLRRVHRQRHAEDQRGPGRDGRGAAARGAVGDVRDAGRLSAVAPGVSPLPATRRLLRVRRRAAPRSQRPLHRRSRALVGQGRAQRRAHGRALRGAASRRQPRAEIAQGVPSGSRPS